MKTIRLVSLFLFALLSGCATSNQQNAAGFLAKVAKMNVAAADVTQTTTGPFYNHSESVTGIRREGDSLLISNLKASFNIPMPVLGVPLLSWSISASALAISGDAAGSLPILVAPGPR